MVDDDVSRSYRATAFCTGTYTGAELAVHVWEG